MNDKEELKRFLSPKGAGIISKLGAEGDSSDYSDEYDDEYDDDDDEVVQYIEIGSEEEKEAIREAKYIKKAFHVSFLIWTVVFLVIGLLLSKRKLTLLTGVLVGLATGLFYINHLYSGVSDVLNCDEDEAVSRMKKDTTVRLLVITVGAAAVAVLVKGDSLIGALLQMLSLKLSVYTTYPITEFMLKKDSEKKK